MEAKFQKSDVVQLTENHKWCGCLGIIKEIKNCGDDVRYLVGIPQPSNDDSCPTAYIFVMESDDAMDYVGKAVLVHADNED